MDEPADQQHRRIVLAHQPFHGVLDLSSGQSLTLHEFIGEGDYGDLVVNKRLALEHDLLEGCVRYVCQRCHKPLVLRFKPMPKANEDRFFLRHRYRSDKCGGTRGMTHEAICALKYANTKESLAHKNYKTLIEVSLAADPAFSETKAEATWFGLDGVRWRKPDVQTKRQGQRIALEVQLSTTFVEVVAQRQAFYRKNFGQLMWFFRDLAIAGFRQAENDIFCSNNRNAFVVTEETLALSLQQGRFALECAWLEPYLDGDTIEERQHRQVVFFDQLQFDVKEERIPRAFFFDYDLVKASLLAEQEAMRPKSVVGELPSPEPLPVAIDYQSDPALRDLMESFFRGFPNHLNNQEFWGIVRTRFQQRGFDLPKHVKYDPVFPVLQAAYSAKLGRPVGCDQLYLIQLANTLFNSHKPALWVFSAMMSHYDRGRLLLERGDRQAWLDKVQQYHQAWIDADPAYVPSHRYHSLLAFLFPEAERALRADPASYVGRKRAGLSS